MSRPEAASAAAAAAVPARRPGPTRASAARAERGEPGAPALATPARPTLWAAATYAVATLLLAWPALLGRFLVNPRSDQYIAGFAFREFAATALKETGSIPLWNPYLFGGMPYVAAMHGDIFYPTFLLRAVLPADVGMTWGMVLHVFLAGLFTFAFLRAVGVGFHGALVGGLAYLLGGNLAGLVSPGHDGKIFIAALLPLVLLMVQRGVREGRLWAWGGLALAVMLAVLTPHPQLLQYLLLVAGAWALFCAFSRDGEGEALPRPMALRRLGLAAVAVGAGMLGGAVQFWPVLEYTPWSPRAGGKGWEHAISYSMPPEELVNTYLPQFSGVLDAYTGRNGIHFHSEYIGAAVLVLAGLAFGAAAGRRKFLWFWTGTLVVATLWALGGFTPFYHLVYALVPGTKFFRAPSTMLYVVAFSVAVLAALGTERALTLRFRPRYAFAWLGVAALVALLATGGMLTNMAASFAQPGDPRVDANQGALTLGAWRSFLAVAGVAGLLLALRAGRMPARAAAWGLAAVVGLDLWSVARLYWNWSPPAAQLYASDPTIEFLKQQTDSGRVIATPLSQEGLTPRDPFLTGDALMVHRVRQVLGYHGNELGRYQQLYGIDAGAQNIANPNFWRLANVRFFLTNTAELPIEGATRVAGPARNAVGSMSYVYRLPGDNPPAWVTPIAIKADDQSVLATVLDPRFDVGRAALFDTAAAVATQAVPQQLPAPLDLPVRVTSRAPGRIALSLAQPAPAGAALVVSENYYPGWTASVDGRSVPVGRADYSLIGVGLPAGAREVVLTFTSPRVATGKAISLAVLAGSLLAMAAGAAMERRRRV
ncbi:YfhO family protein [Roseisolibacter sp. H3M3-2]|uniref:YfhO family protein n=1 Tax=Roseisolibacter sp. H3M3-2 TaxID=3031323 RepID=UPI0023D99BC5|nr:YfhO family protein [Roseisolibacter sp. H3M3-2]MDF1502626.1 YfhO family protein [Roseisolibacter sp. H3M3-2]